MPSQDAHPTPRERDVIGLFADGVAPGAAAEALGISVASVNRHADNVQGKLRVETRRAMLYVCQARRLVDRPDPAEVLDLDPVTELVWAGLRLDVPDWQLIRVLAAMARVEPAEVHSVLKGLTKKYQTSWLGLIRLSFAHGVLSGKEGTDPGNAVGVRPAPKGSCPWNLRWKRCRVLKLRASGLSIEECAQAAGASRSMVYAHLRACAHIAGVKAHRALVHKALCAEVLERPERTKAMDLSETLAAVWRGLVLDVPDYDLPSAISRQSGLPVSEVAFQLERLRGMGMADCRLVLAGWENGVLDEQTTVLAPPDFLPVMPRRRPRPHEGSSPMALDGGERRLLTLVAVHGLTVERAGAVMKITTDTARAYMRGCLLTAKVGSVLALTHKACLERLLPSPPPGEWEVADDVRTVWRAMVLDTPADRLPRDIAMVTGLPQRRVEECLGELRAHGLTDCQLVVEGWARQILDTQAGLTLPRLETRLAAPLPRRAARPVQDPDDPMGLVPAGHRQDPLPEASHTGLEGRHVAGEVYDFVRITPGACRALLEQTGAGRWGPVLGLPAAHTAVLVTEARSGGPGRRGAVGRLWARGGVVRLPEPGRRMAPDGPYWATPAHLPLWEPNVIAWVLSLHEPAPPSPTDVRALQRAGRPA